MSATLEKAWHSITDATKPLEQPIRAVRRRSQLLRNIFCKRYTRCRSSNELSGAHLTPIVEDEDSAAAVARLVRTMHRHALELRAEAAAEQMPIRFLAREVDPCEHFGDAHRDRELPTCVEQRREAPFASGPGAHRGELDEETAFAGLAAGAPLADGEARWPAVAFPEQDGVAEPAREGRVDFAAEI